MENKCNYSAVILAAGFSSRMNEWKPAVIVNGKPMVINTIETALAYCSEVIVISGYNSNELNNLINNYFSSKPVLDRIKIVYNDNYENGMFSSVKRGLSAVNIELDGIFILPADMPFVKVSTYEILAEAKETSEEYDVFIAAGIKNERIKKGHPVLLKSALIEKIIPYSDTEILRDVLKKFRIQIIETDDKGIFFDIDIPADLQSAKEFQS